MPSGRLRVLATQVDDEVAAGLARADQMPYGGLRDSGNTRQDPAYTVREMTEVRTVVQS